MTSLCVLYICVYCMMSMSSEDVYYFKVLPLCTTASTSSIFVSYQWQGAEGHTKT